jgi:hypothetical protein
MAAIDVLARAHVHVALLVAMACACRGAKRDRTDEPVAPLTEWENAREAARAVLESHCSECHDPGSPNALPRALRVFDLGAAEWAAHMSTAQLRDAYGRLGEPIAATLGDAEAVPQHVSDAERATFLRFVELAESRDR